MGLRDVDEKSIRGNNVDAGPSADALRNLLFETLIFSNTIRTNCFQGWSHYLWNIKFLQRLFQRGKGLFYLSRDRNSEFQNLSIIFQPLGKSEREVEDWLDTQTNLCSRSRNIHGKTVWHAVTVSSSKIPTFKIFYEISSRMKKILE